RSPNGMRHIPFQLAQISLIDVWCLLKRRPRFRGELFSSGWSRLPCNAMSSQATQPHLWQPRGLAWTVWTYAFYLILINGLAVMKGARIAVHVHSFLPPIQNKHHKIIIRTPTSTHTKCTLKLVRANSFA